MTVVVEKSAPAQPGVFAPAGRRKPMVRVVLEDRATGLQCWAREFLACRRLIALSVVLVAVALFADYRCGTYVTATPGAKVPDLILDRFDPIDMSGLFIYGYMALIVSMSAYPLLFRVRTFHIVAIQFALLLTLRSLFMIFTHLETPAGSVPVHFPWFFHGLYFENDMFFSGHTAMPFLGFYLFRYSSLRYVYLVGAIVMGLVVLAMHVHYSVDVLAAYFMTYASYQIGNALLRKVDPAYTPARPDRV